MTILTAILAIVLGLAAFCQGTPWGDALYKALVTKPAELMNGSPLAAAAQVVALLILTSFALVAPLAPELIAMAVTIDFAFFVELGALLLVGRAMKWTQGVRQWTMGQTMSKLLRRSDRPRRSRQSRQQRKRGPPPTDPEPWHGPAFA